MSSALFLAACNGKQTIPGGQVLDSNVQGSIAGTFLVSDVTPSAAPAGSEVMVRGVGLTESVAVNFGGVPARIVGRETTKALRIEVPEGRPGMQYITVEKSGEKSSLAFLRMASEGEAVVAGSMALVCKGEFFYDVNGNKLEGTRDCDAQGLQNLGPGSVKSEALATGAVTADALASAAVTKGAIANGAVGTAALADGSVTTPKIADGAVTTEKVADGGITAEKIAAGSVGALAIAAKAVGRDKLADMGCATNEVLKWDGTTWTCAPDLSFGGSGATIGAGDIVASSIDNSHISPTAAIAPTKIADDATHRFVTDAKIAEWSQAFSWGDHATQGYLRSSIYDANNDNKVDVAALADNATNASQLNSQGASYYLNVDHHVDGTTNKVFTSSDRANIASAQADALKWDGSATDLNPSTGRSSLGLGTAATQNVGTGANNVVQLDGTGKLPALDGSALTGITTNWATPGAIGSSTPNTGAFTTLSGATVTANTSLKLKDGDGTPNYAALRAPTTLPTDVTFTLPSDAQGGKFLTTDASGNLSWATPSGSGDMLKSAYDTDNDGKVNAAVNADSAAMAADSAKLNGHSEAFILSADNHTDGVLNKVFTAVEQTKLAGIAAGAQAVTTANVAAAGAVMDSDFTLNGLMTRTAAGTYSTITDNSSNWDSAYAVTSLASSSNTSNTVVRRDASGNFAANMIAANLTGNVTGNVSGTAANITGTVAIANGGTGANDAATARGNLGLGSAATLNAGALDGNVVTVQSGGKLPALDGSALSNLPIATTSNRGGLKATNGMIALDAAGDITMLNATKVGGNAVATGTTPTAGQVLKWSGGAWTPSSDNDTVFDPAAPGYLGATTAATAVRTNYLKLESGAATCDGTNDGYTWMDITRKVILACLDGLPRRVAGMGPVVVPGRHYMFATRKVYGLPFGATATAALTAADSYCQTAAQNAKMPSPTTFKAIISATGVGNSAAERLSLAAPVYNPIGELVTTASNFWSTTVDRLANAGYDEYGIANIDPLTAFTGTDAIGAVTTATNCSDWTSTTGTATVAAVNSPVSPAWINSTTTACTNTRHIMCIGPFPP